jgi:hypothetical protein
MAPCYTLKQPGHSPQAGRLIMPWTQPAPTPHPAIARFSTPRKYEPPHLARLREDLASGRMQLPQAPSTVSAEPASPRVARAFASLRVFDGIDTDATAYDASIAAGPEHLLMATNFKWGLLNKALLNGPGGPPPPETPLLAWFKSVLPDEVDIVFDPRVLYDQHDGRWVLAATAAHYEHFTSGFQVLSVSKTSDPGGEWWIWAFPESREQHWWPDHPTLGVDAHALYLSSNLYVGDTGGPGDGRLRVIPKAAPYAGGVVDFTDFDGLLNPEDPDGARKPAATVFPCHTWGAPGVEFLVSTRSDPSPSNLVTLWTLTDPAGDPQLTCTSVVVARPYPYVMPFGACQQGGPAINAGDAKVRNAVFSGGSIWFAFATTNDGTTASVRWYQLDPMARRPVQEGVFALPNVHHSYPAIIPDMHGNAALVLGRSSSTERVSVQVTARRAADPPNQLPASRILHEGLSVHNHLDTHNRNRWGDYHGAALDPTDGVTLWVYGAYPKTEMTWGTVVGAIRI